MGFMDAIFDAMRLNDDDDEFDNEEYDDFDDEEEEKASFFRRRSKEKEEEPIYTTRREVRAEPVRTSEERSSRNQQQSQNKITPMRRTTGKKDDRMEVCVIKPTSLDDEREITDTLLNGRAVVINMEGLNVDIAQRIIDFTSGSTYAMSGTMQKISNFIFIATPKNVDVSGDLQNLMDNAGDGNFTM